MRNATDAMRESKVPEILNTVIKSSVVTFYVFYFYFSLILTNLVSELKMESLSYKKMEFEEFCAAAISTYQLEALEGWEKIASTAFEHFEREGNRAISVEELAQVSVLFICFYF